MNEDGKKILTLMNQIRTLCMDISNLLETVDSLVAKDGWSTITGKNVAYDNSDAIDKPIRWFPELFYRYYTKEEYFNKLLYVAVILDNRTDSQVYTPEGKDKFEEPILTAGYFDYGDEKVVEGSVWKSEYCKGHFFTDDSCYDGTIYSVRPEKMKYFAEMSDKSLVKRKLKSLALPLVDINNPAKIEKSVIQPLLTDMIQS